MPKKHMPIIIAVLIFIIFIPIIWIVGSQIYLSYLEKPSYTVIKRYEDFEIREYQPLLIAEVPTQNNGEEGINTGFMDLANYIFAQGQEERSDKKIAMTAPVIDSYTSNQRTTSFTLPKEWTLKNLPTPKNKNITIKEENIGQVAVLRFSGNWNDTKLRAKETKLKNLLHTHNIEFTRTVRYAFYDPPFTLPFLKRNEIMIELTSNFFDKQLESNTKEYSYHKEFNIPDNAQLATFAGGCFWCIEAALQPIEGVYDVISGYAGGKKDSASYRLVASGRTEHLEAAQVYFDPKVTSFEILLERFWKQIDPTDDGGQFADRGPQYRTAVYYHNEEQKEITKKSKKKLPNTRTFSSPIVTKILPFTNFFPAEENHQDFYKKEGDYYERYKQGSGRASFIESFWE